jgi:Concanavalin A-like lectin/glucanases superfamily
MSQSTSKGKIFIAILGSPVLAALIGGLLSALLKVGPFSPPAPPQPVNVTATSSPSQNLSPQSIYNQAIGASPVLIDPLNSQDTWTWNTGSSCTFTGNTYHTIEQDTNYVSFCFAQATNFSNFAFQVQMTVVQGNAGGLIFCASSSGMYRFVVDQDGTYNLISVDASNNIDRLIGYETSSAIHTGLNQLNTLTVIRNGDQIYLYINGQYVNTAADSTYTSGEIGFLAWNHGNPTDVVYSNVKVWKL